MHRRGGTRTYPEMPKRTTATTQIPEETALKKRTSSSAPAAVIRLAQSETPVKNLPTKNHSPTQKGGGKPSQRGHSRNQNRSSKKASPDPRRNLVGSPEIEEDSSKGKRKNDSYVANFKSLEIFYGATDFHSASSSSTSDFHSESSSLIEAGHQEVKVYHLEAQHDKLCNCSDDGREVSCDHGDMPSPGQKLSKDSQAVESSLLPEVVQDDPRGVEPLLPELVDDIIGRLPMLEVIQLRPKLGNAFKDAILRPAFLQNRPDSEGEFSPSFFMTDDKGDLHWHGFRIDTLPREWRRLPSLNFAKKILPSPDPDLFKDYLVAGDQGLLCINVGKAPGREKLVMCNPLTQQVKVLPPLKYARHPVLMHLKVDGSGHYKVFVAGSAAIGTEDLSLKTEEYDSRKGVWECPDGSDLPCPAFGLNEYQNGVYFKDSDRELLMCVAIIDTRGRGVLVYDIMKQKWAQGPHVKQLHIPLVRSEPNVSHLATTQIVECGGFVFVFSEQECGRDVYFLIHKLIPDVSGDFTWDEVMRRKRTGGRGLLVYPEFTCVPVSEHELCIFNTVEHTIEIIDLNNPTEVALLQSAPTPKGNRFHSLNPIGFVFKPSFRSVVCPRGRNSELRCDLKLRECCSECERRDSESFMRSRLHMNVVPDVINFAAFVEEPGFKVVTAPTEKIDTIINLVQPVGSPLSRQGRLTKSCGDIDDEARKQEERIQHLVLSK